MSSLGFAMSRVREAAEEGTRALIDLYPGLEGAERAYCLRAIARLARREGLEFVAGRFADLDGHDDFLFATVLSAIPDDTPHADAILPALEKALDQSDFRAAIVVNLATRLCRAGRLAAHPAASRLSLLARWIEDSSYAVYACAALAFVDGEAALGLLSRARWHRSAAVRLEALFSLVHRRVSKARSTP